MRAPERERETPSALSAGEQRRPNTFPRMAQRDQESELFSEPTRRKPFGRPTQKGRFLRRVQLSLRGSNVLRTSSPRWLGWPSGTRKVNFSANRS